VVGSARSTRRTQSVLKRSRVVGSAVALLALSAGLSGCEGDAAAGPAALKPELAKAGTLTVCTSLPYEPFEFKKKGEVVGFDIDLADEVAQKLGAKSVFVNTDFDAIQSGAPLNEGKCDVAVAGMTITGERARVLDFSSPYFDAAQAMVVPKGSGLSALDELGGKKVGVQAGTTGELYVRDNAPEGTKVVTFDDASEIDAALKGDDVDAGVYDNTVVGDVVNRNPGFTVAAEFNTGEQYGMAVKKNGSVDLLRTINDVLAELVADGKYDTIYAKWFGSAPKS
jgi:polar amino acid transport system substrate-binding protein